MHLADAFIQSDLVYSGYTFFISMICFYLVVYYYFSDLYVFFVYNNTNVCLYFVSLCSGNIVSSH